MTKRKTILWIASVGAVALAGGLVVSDAIAADHADSPATSGDAAADLADFYAWHQDGRLVLAATAAGLQEAGSAGTYDAGVLYGFHIDRDGDAVSDHDIWVRFGQNGAGDWGVQAAGMPGATGPIEGAVDRVIDADGSSVYAGPREDPFFFDFEGFLTTLDTGTLSFDSTRDSFAGTNVTGIVLEMDADMAADGADSISVWVTSARKG